MTDVIDSYTGEPYVEDYISKIPDIRRGRQNFYRTAELRRVSEQYWVSPVHPPEEGLLPSGSGELDSAAERLSPPRDPRSLDRAPAGWLVRRKDSPPDLVPLLPSQDAAVRVMDWMVSNDRLVAVVIHFLLNGNFVPYLNLMQDIVQVAADA